MNNQWKTGSIAAAVAVTTVAAFGAIGAVRAAQAPPAAQAPSAAPARGQAPGAQRYTTKTTKEDIERWMKELSNWGRWGADDQLGAVNLITAEKRAQAAALVKSGIVVSLVPEKMPAKIGKSMGPGPQFQGPPIGSSTTSVEYYTAGDKLEYVWEHDYALTGTHNGPHLDAVCHVAYEGKTYNGYPFREITSKEGGCAKLAIANVKDKIVTRGVLIDIAAMKGVPQLPQGTPITREDIEAFEKWAKVRVSPGDAFLYRSRGSLGLDPAFLPFLKERDVALFGGDSAHEGAISVPGFQVAIHAVVMVAMGMNMFDNLNLEALAETCRKLKRWEFMLVATPTPAARGTGAQIAPIAIF